MNYQSRQQSVTFTLVASRSTLDVTGNPKYSVFSDAGEAFGVYQIDSAKQIARRYGATKIKLRTH